MDDEHTRFPAYFIPQAMLAERIKYLKKHYQIISLDKAVQMHQSGKLAPGCAVLTYDDGQYNFAKRAVPVMEEEQVTATSFAISSTFGGCLSQNLVVTDVFLRHQEASGQSKTKVLPANQAALKEWKAKFAAATDEERPECLRELGAELNVDVEPILTNRVWHFMSSDTLKELRAKGFDIQVHTHTHKTVAEHPKLVYEEANTCRERIEAVTEAPATDYCYPSGLWYHDVWPDLEKAGMRSAVTCKVGPNFAATPILALRRYVDDSQKSQLEFESLVSGFEWLLKVLRTPGRFYEPSVAHGPDSPHI